MSATFKGMILGFALPPDSKPNVLRPLLKDCGWSPPTVENPVASKTFANGVSTIERRQDNFYVDLRADTIAGCAVMLDEVITDLTKAKIYFDD